VICVRALDVKLKVGRKQAWIFLLDKPLDQVAGGIASQGNDSIFGYKDRLGKCWIPFDQVFPQYRPAVSPNRDVPAFRILTGTGRLDIDIEGF
jgi:hypothetical protein